jgi:drug/metabolite transporter (DMT)-like permease
LSNPPASAQAEIAQAHGTRQGHGLMHMAMLFVTLCWATNIVAGKEALRGFGPLALAQLRVLGAALVYAFLFLICRKPNPLRLSFPQWMFMLLVAVNGITLNQLLFIGGLARTTVAHTGLIVALGPVMVLLLASLMRLEALTVSKFLGMLISFGGVGILTADKAAHGVQGHWAGDLILLAGSAVFAYYTILAKQVATKFDALTLNALTFGLGALLMMPFTAYAVIKTGWSLLPWQAWWGLAYMIVFGSVVPYLLFAVALTELAASRVAAFSYLQPIIATALGIWLLRENLTAKVVIGGVLILLGVYLTEREQREENNLKGIAQSPA